MKRSWSGKLFLSIGKSFRLEHEVFVFVFDEDKVLRHAHMAEIFMASHHINEVVRAVTTHLYANNLRHIPAADIHGFQHIEIISLDVDSHKVEKLMHLREGV